MIKSIAYRKGRAWPIITADFLYNISTVKLVCMIQMCDILALSQGQKLQVSSVW